MKPAPVQNSLTLKVYPAPDAGHTASFRLKLSFYLILVCSALSSTAQDSSAVYTSSIIQQQVDVSENNKSNPDSNKKWRPLVTAINIAGYGGTLIALNSAWYKNSRKTSFHTFNDSKEWLQVDKVGHGWTAYNTGRVTTALWEWTGIPHNKAVWIGGLSGFVYLTGIEFLDAYSGKWGWSWSDIAANIAGSALFMGQEFLWKEQRIQLKFSFHKNTYSKPMLEDRADYLYGKGFAERMLKDYNAQTYWFSANIKSFFPKSNWPAWLNIAAGYGADGMFGGFENSWTGPDDGPVTRYDIPRKRQYYLAPDVDFTKIKTKSKFLKTTFFMLNAFKCPAPALMIDSKGKFKAYALYF